MRQPNSKKVKRANKEVDVREAICVHPSASHPGESQGEQLRAALFITSLHMTPCCKNFLNNYADQTDNALLFPSFDSQKI